MALITPRMGLRVWNDLDDKYDHEQLADNFAKIDFHNHTPGRGNPIPTAGIEDEAITAAKLHPDAIPEAAINYEAMHIADLYANRPAASAALNGVRFFAQDKMMEFQCISSTWVLLNAYPRRLTALPGAGGVTPLDLVDGEEIELVPPTPYDTTPPVSPQFDEQIGEPIPWRFRWDGVRREWQFIGGTRVFDEWSAYWSGETYDDFTTPATVNEPILRPTTQISITLPYRGVYEVGAFAKGWKRELTAATELGMHIHESPTVWWLTVTEASLYTTAGPMEVVSWFGETDIWSDGVGETLQLGFSSSPGSIDMRLDTKQMWIRPRILYYTDW